MSVLKSKLQLFIIVIFFGYAAWWASFQHVVTKLGTSVQWYGYTYGFIALIGAIIGLLAARKWGGFKTVLGKAILFFSLSLFAQDAGQVIYAYYIVVAKIQIPYPSWGDVAYFGSVLLYITAALFLAKAAGVKYALRESKYKAIAVLVPILLLSISSTIILHKHQFDTSKPLTVLLDVGYPVGEAIYISIAVLVYMLSRKLIGGVLGRATLFVIAAFVVQYIADFTFIYQSDRGTYVPGSYDDFLYLISYFVGTITMVRFYVIYSQLKNKPAVMVPPDRQDR
jgi:hypothetical protein